MQESVIAGPSGRRLIALIGGVVLVGVAVAATLFTMGGPSPSSGIGAVSGDISSGYPSCGPNVTPPCWATGWGAEDRDTYRVVHTPTGNWTLEGPDHNGVYFGPTAPRDIVWWNLTFRANPGTVSVKITHPDGDTTWVTPQPDGWSNHSLHRPAMGNWTFEHHPHTQLERVEVYERDYRKTLIYEYGE